MADGPHLVGAEHRFKLRSTHVTYIPLGAGLLLFYESTSGGAMVYEVSGNGGLASRKFTAAGVLPGHILSLGTLAQPTCSSMKPLSVRLISCRLTDQERSK